MRVVIVGAGSLGLHTARILAQRGCDIVLIEESKDIAREVSGALDCGVIQGDGTRPAVLSQADPEHSDVLLCLTSNAQTNLIASLVGRSLGFERILTRIDDEEFEHVTLELGLSDTVIPARTIGRFLADAVEGHDILELSGAVKGDARVFLFVARKDDAGTIAELELPDGARVSHLYRDGALVLADGEAKIDPDDEVVIVCHRKRLEELRERWAPNAREHRR